MKSFISNQTKLKEMNNKIKRDSLNTLNTDEDEFDPMNRYLIAEKPYRFIIIIITSLLCFANSFEYYNFFTIIDNFQKVYQINNIELIILKNLSIISFVILAIPSTLLIEKKSLKLAVELYYFNNLG